RDTRRRKQKECRQEHQAQSPMTSSRARQENPKVSANRGAVWEAACPQQGHRQGARGWELTREPGTEENVADTGANGAHQCDGAAQGEGSRRYVRNRFGRSDSEKQRASNQPPAAQVAEQDPADTAVVRERLLSPVQRSA